MYTSLKRDAGNVKLRKTEMLKGLVCVGVGGREGGREEFYFHKVEPGMSSEGCCNVFSDSGGNLICS